MKLKLIKNLKLKIGFLGLGLALMIAGFFYFTQKATAAWFDESWLYRKAIAITNNTGSAQTNTQVSFTLGTASLISSGKMQSSCADIRITNSTGNLLKYWTEYCDTTGTNSSVIWATIDSIPTGTSTIYVYYGNSSAPAASQYITAPTGINVGTGNDGDITLATTKTIDTDTIATGRSYADATNWNITTSIASGATTITLPSTPNGLAVGDEILIINLRDPNNADATNYGYAVQSTATSGTATTLVDSAKSWTTNTYQNMTLVITSGTGQGQSKTITSNDATSLTVSTWTTNPDATSVYKVLDPNGWTNNINSIKVGQYETRRITVIATNTLTLNKALTNSYDGTTYKIMVQRIPQYGNVTVNASGILTVSAYNNTNGVGGVLFFRASGTVNVNASGSIDVSGKGYAGGVKGSGGYGGTTYNGAGGRGGAQGSGPTINGISGQGGGGGGGGDGCGDSGIGAVGTIGGAGGAGAQCYGGAGAGGGYGTVGSKGGGGPAGVDGDGIIGGKGGTSTGDGGGGGGGGLYGSANLSQLYLGSGAGGGANDNGGTGGNGGGIIFIGANTIIVSGTAGANGANGAGATATEGGGGGGAGGSVYIKAAANTVGSSLITASGGIGGTPGRHAGGAGGVGRIRVDYSTLSGTTSPATGSTSVLPVSGTSATEEQGPGPVGYWSFDEGQGTLAQDKSSSRNNGTITGAAWTTEDQCVAGKCLKFDGSNDYVDLIGSSDLNVGNGPYTISAWVKNISNGVVLSKRHQEPQSSLTLTMSGGRALCEDDGSFHLVYVQSQVLDSSWHYLSCVKRDSTSLEIWVDGKLASDSEINSTGSLPFSLSSSDNWHVGHHGTWASYFNGFLDEVKIYPYARTSAQIKADYNSRGSQIGTSVQIGPQNQWLSQGLVGYWKMDETATPSLDSSGNGNSGTWYGNTVAAAGKFGNALAVNGNGTYNGDYAEAANSSSLDITSNTISMTAWIYSSSVSSDQKIIFKVPASNDKGYGIALFSSKLEMGLSGVTCNIRNTSGGTTLQSNTWYFVAATYDGSTCKTYMNGAIDKSAPGTGDIISTTATLRIGADQYATNPAYPFHGKIDEIRVYNRALTSAEISSLYNFAPGPVAQFDFEEGSGTTVKDKSGYGNNGTWAGTGTKHWDTGKIGKAGKFNGSNDGVSASIPINNSYTVSLWINSEGNTSTHIWEGTALSAPSLEGSDTGYNFYMNNSENLSTGVITANRWYYISATYDAGSQTQKLYVDGVLKGTNTSVASDTTATLYLATRGGTSRWWKGKIDDVKIYNYARTQKQVVEDMNAGSPSTGSGPHSGAIAHYRFDEGQGIVAHNEGSGGTTLDGTLTGMSSPATSTSGWTNSGKFSKALSFDGSDDYINISNNAALNITGDMTISSWVKVNSITNTYGYIVNKDQWTNSTDNAGYNLIVLSSADAYPGKVQTDFRNNSLNNLNSNTAINDGNWHHVVATYQAGTSQKIYIDGKLDASTTTVASSLGTTTNPLNIGQLYRNPTSNRFNGSIDEVKIYNYALTSDEIRTDFNKGSSLIMGAAGNNSSYAPGAANQDYCVPGDTTSCVAPVGEWNFEEGSGTSVKDTSGNNNTGTWSGTGTQHWTTGKVGKAGKFNGTDDYVDAGVGSSLDFGTGAFTVSLWVKPGSSQLQYANIIGKRPTGSTPNGFTIEQNSDTLNQYSFSTNDGTGWVGNTTYFSLTTGQWSHLVVTRSGTTGKVYVNGILVASPTTVSGSVTTTSHLSIGNWIDPLARYFNGQIDQVRIFNYARTPAQIAWDYNRGAPVGHWKFDECQGSVAHDISDNSNHGTITIGASGEDTLGTCTTSSTAWGSGATGKYNSSMSFDGIDDYVDMGNPSNGLYNFGANNFSLSAWIKAAVHGVYSVVDIVSKDNSGARQFSFFKNAGSADDIRFSIFVGGSEVSLTTATNVITDTNWHHVTAVRSGTNAYIYVDGVLVKSGAMSGTMDITSTTLKVGASDWGHYFKGQIDDVKVFNYALTPLQIKTLYNNGAVYFGPTSGTP